MKLGVLQSSGADRSIPLEAIYARAVERFMSWTRPVTTPSGWRASLLQLPASAPRCT